MNKCNDSEKVQATVRAAAYEREHLRMMGSYDKSVAAQLAACGRYMTYDRNTEQLIRHNCGLDACPLCSQKHLNSELALFENAAGGDGLSAYCLSVSIERNYNNTVTAVLDYIKNFAYDDKQVYYALCNSIGAAKTIIDLMFIREDSDNPKIYANALRAALAIKGIEDSTIECSCCEADAIAFEKVKRRSAVSSYYIQPSVARLECGGKLYSEDCMTAKLLRDNVSIIPKEQLGSIFGVKLYLVQTDKGAASNILYNDTKIGILRGITQYELMLGEALEDAGAYPQYLSRHIKRMFERMIE